MEEKQSEIVGVYPGHDATVVLLRDGKIVEAMSEERLSRCKKHFGFPYLALQYVREKYNLSQIDTVFIAGKEPLRSFLAGKLENEEERGKPSIRQWFKRTLLMQFWITKLLLKLRDYVFERALNRGIQNDYVSLIEREFPGATKVFLGHHEAHAWATVAFMPRDNKPRIIITLDGEGDGLSGSISIFSAGSLEVKHTFSANQSLGLLYCSIVDLLGMKRNEHEFKVMGLAPYAKASAGERVYEELRRMVWFNEQTMQLESAFDMHEAPAQLIMREMTMRHRFDSVAYGMQKLTEEIIKQIALVSISRYGITDLAVGGGVFMNVKANQHLAALTEVTSLVIAPSCGDESLAIGAAVYGYAAYHKNDLSGLETLESLYLGSEYTDTEVKAAIDAYDFGETKVEVTYFDPAQGSSIEEKVAEILAANSVVGRFKGRAEWGARALGNRSILANPTSRDNVKLINEMIKGRDFWMPFATSMLYERRNEYLKNPCGMYAPHMAITFETTERAHRDLIAALHPYDLTSRPQMVRREINPEYHALITHFEKLAGIGGILNTSFNLHGEPNVETPTDALRTFHLSGLPYLAIGNYLCSKVKSGF